MKVVDDWVEDQMSDTDDVATVPEVNNAEEDEDTPGVVTELPADDQQVAHKRRYDRKITKGFGGLAAAAAVIATVASIVLYGGCAPGHPTAAPDVTDPSANATAKPSASLAVADHGTDRSLPYTADAQRSCALGSTPAQNMSGSDPLNAFVCQRDGNEGQVISITLPKPYVISAINLTPGWVGKDGSGVDQWSQHRVVTLAQYTFDHDPATVLTQDTKNVHGEAVKPVKHVLASQITMLIRQTSRPPAQPDKPAPTTGNGLDSVFGTAIPSVPPPPQVPLFGQQPGNTDPVDATFAIGRLQIIGHEAL